MKYIKFELLVCHLVCPKLHADQLLFKYREHKPLSSAEVLVILETRENWKEPLPRNTGVLAPVVL